MAYKLWVIGCRLYNVENLLVWWLLIMSVIFCIENTKTEFYTLINVFELYNLSFELSMKSSEIIFSLEDWSDVGDLRTKPYGS